LAGCSAEPTRGSWTYLGDPGDVSVELAAHETVVGKYKGPLGVEADCDDVFGVLADELLILVDCTVCLTDGILFIYLFNRQQRQIHDKQRGVK
jgi:hypothetical protein